MFIVAGPEFREREGHTLIISKALCGLCSSGLRWSQWLADALRHMGFAPLKAKPDIWMRDKGDNYEHIGSCVDDLMIASRMPSSIIDDVVNKHKFKLKGTGSVTFHLGCNFFHDEEGVMCYTSLKHIEKMIDNYTRIFGQ